MKNRQKRKWIQQKSSAYTCFQAGIGGTSILYSDEAAVALVERLTERELEVARLVAQGLVSRIVGERLGISPRTAELHRSHAMKKLSAASPEHLKNILKSAGAI